MFLRQSHHIRPDDKMCTYYLSDGGGGVCACGWPGKSGGGGGREGEGVEGGLGYFCSTSQPCVHLHSETCEAFVIRCLRPKGRNQQTRERISARETSHEQTTKTRVAYGNSHLACE